MQENSYIAFKLIKLISTFGITESDINTQTIKVFKSTTYIIQIRVLFVFKNHAFGGFYLLPSLGLLQYVTIYVSKCHASQYVILEV